MNPTPEDEMQHQPSDGPLLSPATRAGDLVFVSGQASVDESGAIVAGTFAEEMHRSIDNVRRILALEGLGLDDVVKVNVYLGNPTNLAEYNQLYPTYFKTPRPARTTLVGCLIDAIKFEIDVVACVPQESDHRQLSD